MSLHLCPHCKQTVVVPSSHPPASSTTEEINSITEQAQCLDDAISALNATRAKLLRRLNVLRSSTRKIPPEILSTVFSYASPPFDFSASTFLNAFGVKSEDHGQITLSSVSSYWRQVVCSTPRLWETALIGVKSITVGLKTDLLELYLKNARGVPFSLQLHVLSSGIPKSSDFGPIFRAIQKGGQKFKLLSLSSPPQAWLTLLSSHLPNLEDLRLRWSCNDPDAENPVLQISHLSGIPSLRRVFVEECGVGWAPSDQPCHNITVLHLVDMPLHTCAKLLVLCPNLVEYRCERGYLESDGSALDLNFVTFPNMRFFQAPCNPSLSFGEVLSPLHFLVLETFSFELVAEAPEIEGLLAFIRRLPVTCSTLEIRGSFTEEIITRVIQAVPPQVQSLQYRRVDDWSMAIVLLRALCRDNGTGSFNMPGLRRISLHDISWKHAFAPVDDWSQDLFFNMLSARKELLGGRFILEVGSFDDDMDWTPLQARLRTMASEGLRLEILASGVWIPGLQELYEELGT